MQIESRSPGVVSAGAAVPVAGATGPRRAIQVRHGARMSSGGKNSSARPTGAGTSHSVTPGTASARAPICRSAPLPICT
jgi:hypothetical protein